MSPETGRRFGPYEIQSRLGGGGMGHVYRAWDGRLHREVAIKLLNHEFAMPGMRERFLREARAASALNHPNICSIFDIGEQDGDPYLVMELLEGETLKDRIQEATIPVSEMIVIARETAEALGAAHSKGVVHRDVKPANIFLVRKPNGIVQAKVLDFGLAKMVGGVGGGRSRGSDLTSVGATVGTLAYMSPEQARGEVLDSRSDLFSLGVVMYEMATRQVPFQGATSALVFVQLLNHPPEPVRDWNEAVPRDLEKIIFKLLAKERTARFQTAHELEQALVALQDKNGNGGWLRKAVSAVPLVRASDPVARPKRTPGGSRPSGSMAAAEPTPAGERVLRPVARMPQAATATLSPVPASRGTESRDEGASATVREAPRAGSGVPLVSGAGAATGQVSSGQVLIQPKRPLGQAGMTSGQNTGTAAGVAKRSPAVPSEARNEIVSTVAAGAELPTARPSPFLSADEAAVRGTSIRRRAIYAAAGLAVAGLLAFFYYRAQSHVTLLNSGDALVVAQIANLTGDRRLDDSVSEGLRIALAESPWMVVREQQSLAAAERQIAAESGAEMKSLPIARRAAERLGARVYVAGTLTGDSAGAYVLKVDLRDAKSNDVIASTEAKAGSLQQVPGAIDQVAAELRARAGETRPFDARNSATLAHEATGNLAALQLLAGAHSAENNGQPLAALDELQQAVALDPHFTQAHLELAELYRQLHAETSAAESARLALGASDGASQRTQMLAQAAYEVHASGDLPRATTLLRQVVALFPGDAEVLRRLGETLLLEGHLSEALQNAQQAYGSDPYDRAAYGLAEDALLALDRYDAAFQLQSQVERLGFADQDGTLVAAYLDNRPDVVAQISASVPLGRIEYRPDFGYGLYLDNAGHLAAGSSHWTSRADAAEVNDSLKSAGTLLLAQAAFDRALLGDCKAALNLVHTADSPALPAGRMALFRLGVSAALCGDSARATRVLESLEQQFPRSFEVQGFMAPDIRAAVALREGQSERAIAALQAARPYDLISITPFLRGLAHVGHGEVEVGIVDLQTVLAHRGAAFVGGSSVYPAAEIAVARAFAGSGDLSNSAAAYARFLELWRTADPLNPLVAEARAHAAH